ncbi:hypothetical protein GGQ74_001115 [Desulfobaculum xiamenense]|uniref:Thiamine biosynthesis protein ApbE n=1 Tax=Desulfobaculum xiamenense TaxID=995050 RepID=A0A846QPZ5_9BACT|nr:UPF0280 family protein [Desulfobaculum xiamenense]NJB67475.1 hypothetical protein [Desulfobaculum xiamenense]
MTHAIHTASHRAYRSGVRPRDGETAFQTVIEETDLYIVAASDLSRQTMDAVRELRGQLKAWFALQPEFASSLIPVDVPASAPDIIRRMAEAARPCGVGPMAAVAGTVAQMVAERLAPFSADVLVENGGDLYMRSSRPRTCAILADPEGGASIGLNLKPADFPLSLCASSATIGHSLSLGHGDLVVVRSRSASLADASATALCNIIRDGRDLRHVTDAAQALHAHGLDGVFAQCGSAIAVWGDMELVAL